MEEGGEPAWRTGHPLGRTQDARPEVPSPSQGHQPRLRAHRPGIHTPPGNPTALSLPIAPQPRPVWPLDHALHFPHDLSILKPLTPKNGISILSPNSQ